MTKLRVAALALVLSASLVVILDGQITITPASKVTGGGGFTGQLLAPPADNTGAVPYSFTNDPNTGLASSAADTVDLVAGGLSRLRATTTDLTSNNNLTLAAANVFLFLNSLSGAGVASIQFQEGGVFRTDVTFSSSTDKLQIDGGNVGTILNGNTTITGTRGFGALRPADIATAPVLSGTGFGTAPTIISNGTMAFQITVGAAPALADGTLTMPTIAPITNTGWAVVCQNLTQPTFRVVQVAPVSASVATVRSLNAAGVATAFTAADVLTCLARGY